MISDVLWGLPGPGRWLDRAAQLTTRERFGKISVPKALVKIAIDGLESLIIEKFEERGEGFCVTVVWRGSEKQLVLEVWRGKTNHARPEAFDSIAADGRGNVVSLIDDQ